MKKTLMLMLALAGCGSAGPQAPMMKSVEKMDGALMLYWMNMEPGCTTVEGERKEGTGAYAVAFSVPGEVDNKHDATATKDATYTYRLRCTKGDKASAYSDEMSMNPLR
ncbi:MAG: hypothetical protein INH37_17260 [Myxococcaceae bacterium]|nr:hypothetical protein [Myxococcaceae bacterium]